MAKNLYTYVGVEKLSDLADARGNTDAFSESSGTISPPSGFTEITDDVIAFTLTRPRNLADRTGVSSENVINADGRGNPEARLSIFNDNVTTADLFGTGKGYYAIAVQKANNQTTVFAGALSNSDDQSPDPENGRQITEFTFANSKNADTVWVDNS